MRIPKTSLSPLFFTFIPSVFSAAILTTSSSLVSSTSSCYEASLRNTSWQISDWNPDYNDTASGGASDSSIHFRVRNTVNGYTVQCVRRGEVNMCFWVSGPNDDVHSTTFLFNQTTSTFAISQIWLCPAGEGGERPYILHGHGMADVKTECTDLEQALGDVLCGQQGGIIHAVDVNMEQKRLDVAGYNMDTDTLARSAL